MNSTKESTPETQGRWNTFGINVQRSTRGEIIHLGGISKRRKREEHVLGAHHVPVDRYAGNVAEVN